MSAKRIDGIRAGIDTPCIAYDDLDVVCHECVVNSVERRQGCFRAVQNKVGNLTNGDEKRYCRAVQTLCEHCPFERECER